LEMAKQTIAAHLQASQAENANRGSRIRNILGNFFGGMGESMMTSAGVETPRAFQQRQLTNLLAIQNAQSNEGLRQAHEGLYRLQSQLVDRQMPDGSVVEIPVAHVDFYSSLPDFDRDDLEGIVTDVSAVIDELPQLHSAVWDIFKEVSNKRDTEAYERLLADDSVRVEFYERFSQFARKFAVALSSAS